MADQAPRQPAPTWAEARSMARPCRPALGRPAATDEPPGDCHDRATCAGWRTLLVLRKMPGPVAAGRAARHCRRDVVAAALRRDLDRLACRPACACRIAAGLDAAPASRSHCHLQEQVY